MKHNETTALATKLMGKGDMLFPDHSFLQSLEEFQKLIATRAYELFENSGFTNGHDLDDWLKAEAEFLHPAPIYLEETGSEYIARVEVPGFKENEITTAVDYERIIVNAQHVSRSKGTDSNVVRSETRSSTIFRSFTLPGPIDPKKVSKNLKDGVLEIRLSKKAPAATSAAA